MYRKDRAWKTNLFARSARSRREFRHLERRVPSQPFGLLGGDE
jgi:hypothetical protein